MRATKYLFILAPLLLWSCSDGRDKAADLWGSSIIEFEGGHVDSATMRARELRSFDVGASNFLLGQYEVYAEMSHQKNSSSSRPAYSKLVDAYLAPGSRYEGYSIAAKAFALAKLEGKEAAVKFLTVECGKWKSIGAQLCVRYLMDQAVKVFYATGGEKLESVYLYEASELGGETEFVKRPAYNFYRAVSLLHVDNVQSNKIIKIMRNDGSLSAVMERMYCKFNYEMGKSTSNNCATKRDVRSK